MALKIAEEFESAVKTKRTLIFDRNSQVRFHKLMLTKAVVKTIMHAPVHLLRPNTC
jgi:hypothetical protein